MALPSSRPVPSARARDQAGKSELHVLVGASARSFWSAHSDAEPGSTDGTCGSSKPEVITYKADGRAGTNTEACRRFWRCAQCGPKFVSAMNNTLVRAVWRWDCKSAPCRASLEGWVSAKPQPRTSIRRRRVRPHETVCCELRPVCVNDPWGVGAGCSGSLTVGLNECGSWLVRLAMSCSGSTR